MAVVSVLVCVLWWSCIVDHKNLRKAFRTLEKRCGDTHRDFVSLSQQQREWNDATFEALEDCVTREQYKIFLDNHTPQMRDEHCDTWIFRLRCMMYVVAQNMQDDEFEEDNIACIKFLADKDRFIDPAAWRKCCGMRKSNDVEGALWAIKQTLVKSPVRSIEDIKADGPGWWYKEDEDSPCHGRLGKDDDEPLSPAPFYKD